MSKKICDVKAEIRGEWDVDVWANQGQIGKIRKIPGVAEVYYSRGRYVIIIDHRYDMKSVVEEIVRRCS
jgi:hypothetical protein